MLVSLPDPVFDPDVLFPAQILLHKICIRWSVAHESMKSAVVQPVNIQFILIIAEQRVTGHFVMIPLQYDSAPFRLEGHDLLYDSFAVWPPVHIIADEHELVLIRNIVHFPQKRVEFPVTSVDVTDH
ncbi:hypothetical protein D3C75_1009240 [compost metagenome]